MVPWFFLAPNMPSLGNVVIFGNFRFFAEKSCKEFLKPFHTFTKRIIGQSNQVNPNGLGP